MSRPRHRRESLGPDEGSGPQWRRAELAVAGWLRSVGIVDAQATQGARDGGVDIVATGIVCQVKRHRQPVPEASLQQLVGAAVAARSIPLFFSAINLEPGDSSGYAKAAMSYADRVRLPCFEFDAVTYTMRPANDAAYRFMNDISVRSADPTVKKLAAKREKLSSKRRQSRRRRRKIRRLERSISKRMFGIRP